MFWQQTLTGLATHLGHPDAPVTKSVVCVDRKRQWSRWRNVWESSILGSTRYAAAAPFRAVAARAARHRAPTGQGSSA